MKEVGNTWGEPTKNEMKQGEMASLTDRHPLKCLGVKDNECKRKGTPVCKRKKKTVNLWSGQNKE